MASVDPTKIKIDSDSQTTRGILQALRDWWSNGIDFGSLGKFTTLEANTLKLDTAVPTPANGQLGAGDAAWIVPGVGSGPAFNANGHWSNFTTPGSTTHFRKLPSGLVIGEMALATTTANDTTAAWIMPVGYRPNAINWYFCLQYLLATGSFFTIDAAGNVVANPSNNATKDFIGAFAYFADA